VDISEEPKMDIKAYKVYFLSRLHDKLKAIQARSKYIKEIASSSVFGQGLNSAVKKATDNLNRVIKNIDLDIKGKDDEKTKTEKAEFEEYKKREGTLSQCLNKILEEAAKLKTQDID
jgi:type II secretory ATPase GspE/PulE/Tfp pilus assembly ATPase PilB-like protein